jgi:hypothetical protein
MWLPACLPTCMYVCMYVCTKPTKGSRVFDAEELLTFFPETAKSYFTYICTNVDTHLAHMHIRTIAYVDMIVHNLLCIHR